MRVLKTINQNEFQKCGDIMVANKKNQFAMACKFCSEIYTQLQSFMRHLHHQHNDILEFSKETDVYDIEELLNQTSNESLFSKEDCEESVSAEGNINQWLKDVQGDNMELEGESILSLPEKESLEVDEIENDENNAFANMSILRALEDCDVSFNFDNLKNVSTNMEQKENTEGIGTSKEFEIDDNLLKDIQAHLEISDFITSPNKSEKLWSKTNHVQEDNTKTEKPTTTATEKIVGTKTKEHRYEANSKCLRKLLEGLDELEDVDTLLENFVKNINTADKEQCHEANEQPHKTQLKQKLLEKTDKYLEKNENITQSSPPLKQLELEQCNEIVSLKTSHKNKNNVSQNYNEQMPLRQNTVLPPKKTNKIQNSTTRNTSVLLLNEIEALLDIDNPNKNEKFSHATPTVINKINDNYKPKLINKENSDRITSNTSQEKGLLNTGNSPIKTFSYNIAFRENLTEDFEFHLKNVEKSINYEEEIDSALKESIESVVNESFLHEISNEDLTKAIADAMKDEEVYKQHNAMNETLNKELLECLNQELSENEADLPYPNIMDENIIKGSKKLIQNLTSESVQIKDILKELLETEKNCLLPNDDLQTNTVIVNRVINQTEEKAKENYLSSMNKNTDTLHLLKNDSSTVNKNALKYQKTNLKAKSKCNVKQNCTTKPTEHAILKERKIILNINQQNLNNMIKSDYETLKKQKQLHNTKQLIQRPQAMQNCTILNENHSKQMKTPPIQDNKENDAITVRQANNEQKKNAPTTNFINLQRGERTPLKQEQLFSKQSPKTQEEQNNISPETIANLCSKPATKKCLSSKPKGQQSIVNNKIAHYKTPDRDNNITSNKYMKKNSKSDEKLKKKILNITPPQENNKLKQISPKTPSPKNTSAVAATIKKQGAQQIEEKANNVSQTENKLKTSFRIPLTTPQRVRVLSVKLPKITPEKLMQKIKSNEIKTVEYKTKSKTNSTYKSPEAPHINSSDQKPTNDKFETPVKLDYCQQNYTTNSLKTTQEEKKNNKYMQNTILSQSRPALTKIKPEAICSNVRQRTPSIDILPASKEHQKALRHNNLNVKSYVISRSTRKKEILQRMHDIKKQIFNNIDYDNYTIKTLPKELNKQKRKVHIENVQALPNLNSEILTPLVNSQRTFEKSNDLSLTTSYDMEDNKKSFNKQSLTPLSGEEKLFKGSLKRSATSPLLNEKNPIKRAKVPENELAKKKKTPHKSKQEEKTNDLKSLKLQHTKLNLSDNDEELIQKAKLTSNMIDDDMPIDDIAPNETSLESNENNNDIIDDLLQQVNEEQESKNDTLKDFNESQDIELLDKFGLRILKKADIESDGTSVTELKEMIEKSRNFARLYQSYPKIWSLKAYSENNVSQNDLQASLKHMLNKINDTFKQQISISELKRLINLISLWYFQAINSKFNGKKNISEIQFHFLTVFNFIPKTIGKRFYFCEYCSEYFNTEHRYYCHRIIHTGAMYPYTCQKCSVVGYKMLKSLKAHEKICPSYNRTTFQCQLCSESFETSALLYQHSKKHLKTTYNCSKCELVFASAIDVKNHMIICNKSEKNMPKQYTPRPTTQRRSSLLKN